MNVLVLIIRGFHLGYLGCYGNPWLASPHLDRLAGEGIVFDQHFADAPSPEGADHSWRTGRFDFPQVAHASGSQHDDLFAICKQHGVQVSIKAGPRSLKTKPAAPFTWIETSLLLPPWNLSAGLLAEHFQPPVLSEEDQIEEELNEDEPDESLEPLLDPSIGPMDPGDDQTFLRLQQTYGTAVAALDDALGPLLEVDDDTMIVLTSDHGLPLGEHGMVGLCRPWLHDELIHIPLIVRLPGGAEAGRRVAAFTQSIDLMPTLLQALGMPIPDAIDGRCLLPLCQGGPGFRDYAIAGLRLDDAMEWAIRTPEWAYLLPQHDPNRQPQLFVKPDDRWEVNDVRQHQLELADQLDDRLRRAIR